MPNIETKAPARTFKDLLNVHDGDNNEGIEAGLKVVQDGEGVASALSLSETEAKVTGDFAITGELSVDSIDVNGVGTTGAGNIATTSLKVDDHLEAGSIETQGDLTVGGGGDAEITGDVYIDGKMSLGQTTEIEDGAYGLSFHHGSLAYDFNGVVTMGDGSTLKTDAAPTADAEIANKKYVDDNAGGSATQLSTGTITGTTYGITSDGGVDDVVLAEADTNNSGVLGSAKWDEIVVNTAHSGGDGSDHADVATNTSHSGGDGSDHADVATNTSHSGGDGSDHADVATNTSHSGGDGSDHADVATNTSHSGGDGSDHADVATNTLKATCDTTNVKSALNASLGGAANIGDANDTVTVPGSLNISQDMDVDGEAVFVSQIDAQQGIALGGQVIEGAFAVDDKISRDVPPYDAYDVSDIIATHSENINGDPTDAIYNIELVNKFQGGFLWNDDGTKFWIPCKIPTLVAGGSVEKLGLFSYTCTTPYDWGTKVIGTLEGLINNGFVPGMFGNGMIMGVEWNDDGTIFYLITEDTNAVAWISAYDTDAPYTILTSPGGTMNTFDTNMLQALSEDDISAGFSVHTRVDGNDGYIFAGQNDVGGTIARWAMNGDVIDSGTPDQTISVPNNPGANGKVAVRVYDSGTKMMIYGANGNVGSTYYGWQRFSLSVAYDLTSNITLLEAVNYDSEAWKKNGYGFDWSPDGLRCYGTGNAGMWGESWLVQHTIGEPEHYLDLNTTPAPKIGYGLQIEGPLEAGGITSTGNITGATIDATKLTGDLPAISGSNLTGVQSARYAHSFWSHNFVDEINTGEIRMPWADTTEASSSTGRQAFLAPYDMTFVAWNYRYEGIANSHDLTFRIYKLDQGDQTDDLMGEHTFFVTSSNDHETFQVIASDIVWPVGPPIIIDAGDLIVMTIEAMVDPGSSTDHFMTSHWIMDLDSTYTTGNV